WQAVPSRRDVRSARLSVLVRYECADALALVAPGKARQPGGLNRSRGRLEIAPPLGEGQGRGRGKRRSLGRLLGILRSPLAIRICLRIWNQQARCAVPLAPGWMR